MVANTGTETLIKWVSKVRESPLTLAVWLPGESDAWLGEEEGKHMGREADVHLASPLCLEQRREEERRRPFSPLWPWASSRGRWGATGEI